MKTLVTGKNGLVGSEIKSDIKIGREFNLLNSNEVDNMFNIHKPTHVINCAAKVGGIGANMNKPGQFLFENLMIGTNIIEYSRKHKVNKLINFSSTCIFPDKVEYPLTEEKIHLGPPHETNYGYGYAKRMADIQIKAYNQEYNTKFFSVIPCNIYGPNDNYNVESSHVIPSLIHKVYLSKINNENISVWGSGKALREFIYSKDVAKIVEKLLYSYEDNKSIILSTSVEVSIEELVVTICDIFKFKNKIIFDKSRPDGQLRKPSNNSYLKSIIGDFKFTEIRNGLEETIDFFIKNYKTIRK
jgi:GDP-L-fucose synthase